MKWLCCFLIIWICSITYGYIFFQGPLCRLTQIFLKYSMLGNRIFLVQHAKTRQAMRNALFSCCSLLKDLLLSEHLSCMLLLSEPHSGRASSPKTFPSPASHHSPFPILAQWFSCAHLFSGYSPPSPKSDEDGMGKPHRWYLCSSLEGATHIQDQTKNADLICIFLGNWTWRYWFPETMLWKLVTISTKYREVEVKGIHREKDK